MRLLRNIFGCFAQIARCLDSRSVRSHFYAPRDSTTDLFAVAVPIQEGVENVEDVDVIINADTKEIIVVAKRKPTIQIDVARFSPISASSSLEDCSPSQQFLEPVLR